MPGLSGVDVILESKRLDPERPVIMATGHSFAKNAERLAGIHRVERVAKPFTAGIISQTV